VPIEAKSCLITGVFDWKSAFGAERRADPSSFETKLRAPFIVPEAEMPNDYLRPPALEGNAGALETASSDSDVRRGAVAVRVFHRRYCDGAGGRGCVAEASLQGNVAVHILFLGPERSFDLSCIGTRARF
jgi:hypothetical protein